jgi:hypothetical protein
VLAFDRIDFKAIFQGFWWFLIAKLVCITQHVQIPKFERMRIGGIGVGERVPPAEAAAAAPKVHPQNVWTQRSAAAALATGMCSTTLC